MVYLASWTGWFATSNGYDRNWAAAHGNHTPVWSTIDSWYQYNHWMLQFGLGLSSFQSYKSNPLGWTILARPISFYWCSGTSAGCAIPKGTVSEVLAIGTPLIWWGGTLALLFCLGWWLTGFIGDLVFSRTPARRDWRAGAILLGVLAGWLPWIWYAWHDNRTEFFYYAVAFEPFMIIAIVLCLGLIIGPARAAPGRRAIGAVGAGLLPVRRAVQPGLLVSRADGRGDPLRLLAVTGCGSTAGSDGPAVHFIPLWSVSDLRLCLFVAVLLPRSRIELLAGYVIGMSVHRGERRDSEPA